MEKITFTNSSGESFVFDDTLVSINGLGDVESENQTQKSPFQDGSTFIDSLLEERPIEIAFIIKESTYENVSKKRSEIARVTNPKLGIGTLLYETDFIKREIEAVADSVPFYPAGEDRSRRYQKGLINFTCPNPYWKSLDITEEPAFEPLFSFPFEGEFQMGIQRDQRIIVNDGDSPAPVYIEFYGPATNPIITNNTTGEYIKVNQTLGENEYLRIDTTRGKKSVEFVAEDGTVTNVFNWINLGSTFFQLVIGENDIQYSADSDIQGAIVNIRYNKLYNAI
jgi:Phage tail protein